MKKAVILLLMLLACVGLAGCNSGENENDKVMASPKEKTTDTGVFGKNEDDTPFETEPSSKAGADAFIGDWDDNQ